MIPILRSLPELDAYLGGFFVPTMGALHAGHFALVQEAARLRSLGPHRSAKVIVSIFVNPTQFNDPRDLERYPRTLEADALGCMNAGADAIFAPDVHTIYPPPPDAAIVPPLPAVATTPGLEDASRTGHFAGVCQVVKRLFEILRPTAALFGEKDWQQLQVIRAMTIEQQLPVQIIPYPTIREPDGLAMSSRNVFLSPQDRPRATALIQALRAGATESTPDAAETAMRRILAGHQIHVEYAVARDADTLMQIDRFDHLSPARLLIAVRLGPIRLIDNLGKNFLSD